MRLVICQLVQTGLEHPLSSVTTVKKLPACPTRSCSTCWAEASIWNAVSTLSGTLCHPHLMARVCLLAVTLFCLVGCKS
jgi:hypothetical protein